MTPPRNPPVFYNNPSFSQPSLMTRDSSLTNTYLSDLNKFPHVKKEQFAL